MKIALLGYGKMGQMVEKLSLEQGHQIIGHINTKNKNWDLLKEADVCIDFSHADAVLEHVQKCILYGKNLVIGTTGWEDKFDQIKDLVEKDGIGLIYSPNFSLGIFLFLKILGFSAPLMDGYQAGGVETHHTQKKDIPSGTAKEISKRFGIKMESVRMGATPGKHSVVFNSPFDTITFTHEAHNRLGFTEGALKAAKWIEGRKGFYTIEDLIHAS